MEIWKDMVEFDNKYQISNKGNVRRKGRKVNSAIQPKGYRYIKPKMVYLQNNGNGYLQIYVSINKKRVMKYVHRMVATYFLKNPLNYNEVNHLDFNRSNNDVSNLEWCSKKQNIRHSFAHNKTRRTNGKTPVKIIQICESGNIVWKSAKEIGEKLNVDPSGVYKCCKNKLKSVKGHKFKYYDSM